ncbi:MAG: hypothetical protein C0514_03800 [Candidatus Puniceispirillum sp.]|nr:hypothetical protein [Candidatus Puniceispirillum sp.]
MGYLFMNQRSLLGICVLLTISPLCSHAFSSNNLEDTLPPIATNAPCLAAEEEGLQDDASPSTSSVEHLDMSELYAREEEGLEDSADSEADWAEVDALIDAMARQSGRI